MTNPNEVLASAAVGDHAVRHWAIEANGASFPVVEQGEGPAVLFLHGSPHTAERGVARCKLSGVWRQLFPRRSLQV